MLTVLNHSLKYSLISHISQPYKAIDDQLVYWIIALRMLLSKADELKPGTPKAMLLKM
jgi:hypothetical protein